LKKIKKISVVFIVAIFVALAFNISVVPTNHSKFPMVSVGVTTAKGDVNVGPGPSKNCIIRANTSKIEFNY
jgi:hypothetical protein